MRIDTVSKQANHYKKLEKSAFWVHRCLDTPNSFDEEDITHYKDFLSEKSKSPLIADIIMNDVQKTYTRRYPKAYYFAKKEEMENVSELKPLVESINKQNKSLYPKTGKLRQTLISNNRFHLFYVKPKLHMLDKFILKLRSFI
jgi:hypothetical protein